MLMLQQPWSNLPSGAAEREAVQRRDLRQLHWPAPVLVPAHLLGPGPCPIEEPIHITYNKFQDYVEQLSKGIHIWSSQLRSRAG